MRRTEKEINEQTVEWLNERWFITNMEDSRPQDVSYYDGAIKAIEFLGYSWVRDDDGKHRLFKNN